jgi:ABC-type uncharacterized transport system substrate-binding protein
MPDRNPSADVRKKTTRNPQARRDEKKGEGRVYLKWACLAVTLIFVLFSTDARANPDVWVKAAVTYKFQGEKLASVGFEWRFDEYFSTQTIRTYDANQNGTLEANEIERLHREVFEPLKKFEYYVHVWVGQEKRQISAADGFSAAIDNANLIYRFNVPLAAAADPVADEVIVSLRDKETVVDFRLHEKNFILVEGGLRPDCKFKIGRGKGAQTGHAQPISLKCGGSK